MIRDIAYCVLLAAIAFGAIWMGYEQHVANHIMTGVMQMATPHLPAA